MDFSSFCFFYWQSDYPIPGIHEEFPRRGPREGPHAAAAADELHRDAEAHLRVGRGAGRARHHEVLRGPLDELEVLRRAGEVPVVPGEVQACAEPESAAVCRGLRRQQGRDGPLRARAGLERLSALFEASKLSAHVDKNFSLENAAEAFAYSAGSGSGGVGEHIGKVAITMA